jgi:hypothetical protein
VRAWSASLLIKRLESFDALVFVPLSRQPCFDITSTESFFTEKGSTNAGEFLIGRPQTGFAGGRRHTNFVVTGDKEGRRGAFPFLITQNTVVIVVNTDRLVPNEGLVEVLPTEVIGVHDLGLKRLLVADNDALRRFVVCTLNIAEKNRAMSDWS